ncbi:pectinesterase family protein [Sphingomonas sp. RS2018]
MQRDGDRGDIGRAMLDRRSLIAAAATVALAPLPAAARTQPVLTVSTTPGRDRFPTLTTAIAAAATLNTAVTIRLTKGVWREKPVVDVADLTIVGDGPDSILVHGTAAGHFRPDGTRYGTGGSATLTVTAPGLILRDLTIANDFDYLGSRRDAAGNGAQAVALSIAPGAGCTARVERCTLTGYQDTLYIRDGRQWFTDCRIVGGVDFIFGGAQARFDRCRIVSRAVQAPVAGYIAAPSTPAVKPIGFVFHRCRLEREAGLADATVYLGRPWRAGGNMALLGAAAFIDCWMDAHIRRDGWTSMGYSAPDGTRPMLTPQEARLFEYGSRGPGAGPAGDTRRMLDARAAAAMLAATQITNGRSRKSATQDTTQGGK